MADGCTEILQLCTTVGRPCLEVRRMTIQDLLDEWGIPYKMQGEHQHATRGFVQIDCPFCSPDSGKFRLGIRIESESCSCWTCGFHRLGDTLLEITKEPWAVIWKWLKQIGSSGIGRLPTEKPQIRPIRLPTGRSPLSLVHRRYLAGRGLDADLVASRWGLEGIGIHAILGWRIFIPIHLHGKIVSWTTRAIGNHPVRYLSADPKRDGGLSIKHLLYGEDYARYAIVVVEGPADVWRIGPGAVATFGTAYSQEQIARLARYPVRVVCFDAEPQAQRTASRLCEQLHLFPGETYQVKLPSGDPGEASEADVLKIRESFLDT